jgi:SecD/SecF fusion protein
MSTDTDLKLLRELTSDDGGPAADSEARARAALLAHVEIAARRSTPGDRRWGRLPLRLDYLAIGLSAVVVIAVVAVFIGARGSQSPVSPSAGGVTLVYQVVPTRQTSVTAAVVRHTISVLRARVAQLGVSRASVRAAGAAEIVVRLADVKNLALAEQELGRTARIEFYDWEANALTSDGHTVASQLPAQDSKAISISEGASAGPGVTGAGSTSLYAAVKLASKQPLMRSVRNSRLGSQYYMFGRGGSSACAVAARFYRVPRTPVGSHCLLSGPDDSSAGLIVRLPAGVTRSEGQTLVVKQGTVVLAATPNDFEHPASIADPTAQFYVLKDNVALSGHDITNPHSSTDSGGAPDIAFGFTAGGAKKFERVTRTVAHRGQVISGSTGAPLLQHFAIAIDNNLLSVVSIDFRSYPDGLDGSSGAQLPVRGSPGSAQLLASELRAGALPVNLKLVSATGTSATHR